MTDQTTAELGYYASTVAMTDADEYAGTIEVQASPSDFGDTIVLGLTAQRPDVSLVELLSLTDAGAGELIEALTAARAFLRGERAAAKHKAKAVTVVATGSAIELTYQRQCAGCDWASLWHPSDHDATREHTEHQSHMAALARRSAGHDIVIGQDTIDGKPRWKASCSCAKFDTEWLGASTEAEYRGAVHLEFAVNP